MPDEIDDTTRALLQEVLKRLCGIIQCEDSTLWIAEGAFLMPVIGVGIHSERFIGKYSHPLDEGIISMVHASGQPFCENNIRTNPHHSARLDQQLGVQTDAMVATTVVSKGEIVGILTCVHTSPAGETGTTLSFQATDMGELEFTAALTSRVLDSI